MCPLFQLVSLMQQSDPVSHVLLRGLPPERKLRPLLHSKHPSREQKEQLVWGLHEQLCNLLKHCQLLPHLHKQLLYEQLRVFKRLSQWQIHWQSNMQVMSKWMSFLQFPGCVLVVQLSVLFTKQPMCGFLHCQSLPYKWSVRWVSVSVQFLRGKPI